MATIKYQQPVKIVIGNVGSRADSFIPCKENFNVVVQPGDTVTLEGLRSFEGIYYEGQQTENLKVGISAVEEGNAGVSVEVGSYDSSAPEETAFTAGAPYNVIANENNFEVVGVIPYLPADPSLGMAAGNRFTVKIKNPTITSRDNLAGGKMCKVTNTQIEGGYNEYTKAAFERDGSLIVTVNVARGKTIEVKIKWKDELDWVTYTYTFEEAQFLQEGEEAPEKKNLTITPGATIKITNEHDYKVDFVLYKENNYKTVEANSYIELTGRTVGEILYYMNISELKAELI